MNFPCLFLILFSVLVPNVHLEAVAEGDGLNLDFSLVQGEYEGLKDTESNTGFSTDPYMTPDLESSDFHDLQGEDEAGKILAEGFGEGEEMSIQDIDLSVDGSDEYYSVENDVDLDEEKILGPSFDGKSVDFGGNHEGLASDKSRHGVEAERLSFSDKSLVASEEGLNGRHSEEMVGKQEDTSSTSFGLPLTDKKASDLTKNSKETEFIGGAGANEDPSEPEESSGAKTTLPTPPPQTTTENTTGSGGGGGGDGNGGGFPNSSTTSTTTITVITPSTSESTSTESGGGGGGNNQNQVEKTPNNAAVIGGSVAGALLGVGAAGGASWMILKHKKEEEKKKKLRAIRLRRARLAALRGNINQSTDNSDVNMPNTNSKVGTDQLSGSVVTLEASGESVINSPETSVTLLPVIDIHTGKKNSGGGDNRGFDQNGGSPGKAAKTKLNLSTDSSRFD